MILQNAQLSRKTTKLNIHKNRFCTYKNENEIDNNQKAKTQKFRRLD